MWLEDAKKIVDYFVAANGGNLSTYIASAAAILSFISIIITVYSFHKQQEHSLYSYLADIWNDVLDTTIDNPDFINATTTENYFDVMSADQYLKYDIYCYKCWGNVEDIVIKNFHNDKQFSEIIRWVCAHHFTWLKRNPTFFTLEKFWEIVEKYLAAKTIVYANRTLPTKSGEIDWDVVSNDYHRYILSPFAPEMTLPTAGKGGACRNLLLNYISNIPDQNLKAMDIADFGCGPGNLIDFLTGRINRLTGIDSSRGALDVATSKAARQSLTFYPIHTDMQRISKDLRFDLIVSVNSIVPKERHEVVSILRAMRSALKPSGRIVAILPSFDTTQYLISLWEQYYLRTTKNNQHTKRIIAALRETKKMDQHQLSYADDGHHVQCYHTPESIENEFKSSGLCLVTNIEKVYYPWSLSKRFDYGFFPDAPEEIWDWFVIAEPS